jgi:lysophospholipase L1-like esterase
VVPKAHLKKIVMKKIVVTTFCFLLLLLTVDIVTAQKLPFYEEIQQFKKNDSASAPAKGAILFVGSSSFRKWTDVQTYFPGHKIINHGFGGSSFPDVIRYAYDVIVPYKPKQVVIYCGDNDLASSDSVSAQLVAARFKALFFIIRAEVPHARITFVSIKPSPSRDKLMFKMKQTNKIIKRFLEQHLNTSYIDVFTPMLAANGKAKPELFLEDNLHMNKKGYEIWQKAMHPYLLK